VSVKCALEFVTERSERIKATDERLRSEGRWPEEAPSATDLRESDAVKVRS
jgi:hypothetical protein